MPLPLLVLVGLAALLVLLTYNPSEPGVVADVLATIQGRGARVGVRTTADPYGVIPDDPQYLANAAALTLDVYALARMIASENGASPLPYKVAVAWAVMNHSKGHVAAALLAGNGPVAYHFARQDARYVISVDDDGTEHTAHGGKYASTVLDPHEDDVTIAKAVVGMAIPDPTGGATNFYSPRVQDAGYDAGKPGYSKSAADVDEAWTAGGLARVEVAGVDPRELSFYRPLGVG